MKTPHETTIEWYWMSLPYGKLYYKKIWLLCEDTVSFERAWGRSGSGKQFPFFFMDMSSNTKKWDMK